ERSRSINPSRPPLSAFVRTTGCRATVDVLQAGRDRQPGGQGGASMRAPWIIFASLVGAAIGVGTFTFGYAQGHSYLSDDPAACANCHVMREQYDGWVHGSHAAVAGCNDCHTPPAILSKYVVKAENGF